MKLIKKMTHKQKEIITIIIMSIILFASIFLDISGFQPLSFLAAKNDTNLEDGLKLLKEVYEREIDKAAGDYKDMDSLLSEVFTKLNNEKDTEKLTLLLSFVLELYIKANIESNIVQYIISDSVAEGHIPVRKLKRNDKNKQKQLIKMAFEQRLNTDTLIGGSNYYPYESNPFMLMKHCKDYNKIETETGEKRVYLLDSKKITAVVSDISFYMYNISEEELNSRKRKLEDGTITYRTTNNSYLPFSREQYRRYINQHEKTVLITARIEVQFEDDICGVGIEVL